MTGAEPRYLLLSGGVGGAKLARGFSLLEGLAELAIVVNVGDDFEHLGLYVSPDIDTVLYTLAGIANRDQGWGIEDESWRTLRRLGELGGEDWFRLGDLDLATHLYRTDAMGKGQPLSGIIDKLAQRLDVHAHIWPATDQRLRTVLETDRGSLDFQHYFVRDRCAPTVIQIHFDGVENARPSPPLEAALAGGQGRFDAVILTPSNPFLSLDPILAIPGMPESLRAISDRIVAVSPIIAGKAVKGPTAKLMAELQLDASVQGWQSYLDQRYPGLIDEWVIDRADEAALPALTAAGLRVLSTDTLMRNDDEKQRLAEWLLRAGGDHA